LDNSNVWISAKKFIAYLLSMRENPNTRIEFGRLLHTVVKEAERAEMAPVTSECFLYGSEPPPNDAVWNIARENQWTVHKRMRNGANKEKAIDTKLVADCIDALNRHTHDDHAGDSEHQVAILAGDEDMMPVLEACIIRKIKFVVWSWSTSLSRKVKELTNQQGSMARLCLFDEHVSYVCFFERWFNPQVVEEPALTFFIAGVDRRRLEESRKAARERSVRDLVGGATQTKDGEMEDVLDRMLYSKAINPEGFSMLTQFMCASKVCRKASLRSDERRHCPHDAAQSLLVTFPGIGVDREHVLKHQRSHLDALKLDDAMRQTVLAAIEQSHPDTSVTTMDAIIVRLRQELQRCFPHRSLDVVSHPAFFGGAALKPGSLSAIVQRVQRMPMWDAQSQAPALISEDDEYQEHDEDDEDDEGDDDDEHAAPALSAAAATASAAASATPAATPAAPKSSTIAAAAAATAAAAAAAATTPFTFVSRASAGRKLKTAAQHEREELEHEKQQALKSRIRPCRHWAEKGVCNDGAHCFWWHEETEARCALCAEIGHITTSCPKKSSQPWCTRRKQGCDGYCQFRH